MRHKIIRLGKQFMKRFIQADVLGYSAQLAYFLLLSLFPFLLFLITLLSYLPIESYSIIEILDTFLPRDVMTMIDSNISTLLENRNNKLLSISVIGTLWSASKGIDAITKSFNRAYEVESKRPYLMTRIIAFMLTLGMIFVISIALLLPVFGKIMGEQFFAIFNLSDNVLNLWDILRYLISSMVFFIVFFFLHLFGSQKRIKVRNAIWGALFITISLQIISLFFSIYMNTLGNYAVTYGTLGTIIVLMIWFYIVGIIINTSGVLITFLTN